jgi:hypothetical protein
MFIEGLPCAGLDQGAISVSKPEGHKGKALTWEEEDRDSHI